MILAKRKRGKTNSLPNVGEEELAVLKYVQDKAPVSVREVADHFADLGKARTTVLTVMERLRGKGLLRRFKRQGRFQYEAVVESKTLISSLVATFVRKVLGGSVSPFVTYLSEEAELSDEEVEQLQALVDDLKRKRPASGNRRGKR